MKSFFLLIKQKFATIVNIIKSFFFYFLRHPHILFIILIIRYFYFKFTGDVKTMNGPYNISNSNSHNLDGMQRLSVNFFMPRFDRLMFSMLANEKFNYKSKILVIGPRSESDILKLKAYGYSNIEAIDLISYSKSIILMDAHDMTYQDNTFDVVMCGWVLPYSKNPQKIADSIVRVSKNESLISIGIEYLDTELINSIDKIKFLFKKNIKNIFFEYDAHLKGQSLEVLEKNIGLSKSQIMISFSLTK